VEFWIGLVELAESGMFAHKIAGVEDRELLPQLKSVGVPVGRAVADRFVSDALCAHFALVLRPAGASGTGLGV
jgi:hypothetical protein